MAGYPPSHQPQWGDPNPPPQYTNPAYGGGAGAPPPQQNPHYGAGGYNQQPVQPMGAPQGPPPHGYPPHGPQGGGQPYPPQHGHHGGGGAPAPHGEYHPQPAGGGPPGGGYPPQQHGGGGGGPVAPLGGGPPPSSGPQSGSASMSNSVNHPASMSNSVNHPAPPPPPRQSTSPAPSTNNRQVSTPPAQSSSGGEKTEIAPGCGGPGAKPSWAQDLPRVPRYDYSRCQQMMMDRETTEDGKQYVKDFIEEAQNEHVKRAIDFGADQDTMKKQFGEGVVYFFDFIKFITISNLFLIALQAINYGVAYNNRRPDFKDETTYDPVLNVSTTRAGYDDLFITFYGPDQRTGWYAVNIICIAFCFLCAPMYYCCMKRKNLEEDAEGSRDALTADDRMLRYNNDCTIDTGYYYRPGWALVVRRIFSIVVFMVLILVQILASWFITKGEEGSSLGQAFGIAILVSVLNVIYGFIARLMTEFEKWELYSRWKRSLTLKLILFKLGNIITVYSAKDYTSLGGGQCVYDIVGEQFLTLLIVETVFMNAWELISTLIHAKNYLTYAKFMASITGDKDNLPQFDLALEYLEVIYRQYLTMMSMIVFPLSVVLGTFGFLVEYLVDKIRLYKICGKPKRQASSQKGFLSFNLVMIVLASFFTPYAGALFMMAGWTRDRSAICVFP